MSSEIRRPLIRTLRGRLTFWHLATLAVTLSVFAALLYSAVSRSLYQHHDDELRQQAQEAVARLAGVDVERPVGIDALVGMSTSPGLLMIRNRSGDLLFQEASLIASEPNIGRHAALVHAAQTTGDAPEFFTVVLERAGAVRFICVPLAGSQAFLQIGDPLGDIRATLDTVAVASITLVPIVLLASALVGSRVVGQALAPVRAVTSTLEDIHAADLSRRVELHPADQDLGALVTALNRLLDRLERAFESLREFAGDVSHQIQTPLTVIRGALEKATREPAQAATPACVSTIAAEIDSLRTLTIDLRALALADAPIVDPGAVDLSAVVDESSEIIAALGELRDVSVRSHVAKGVTVRGDATRLKQVLLNLGDNAVKYTRAGGDVTIDLSTTDGMAVLRVADTGVGILEKDVPRLFERLFRAPPPGQRTTGTGLGLAIVKRIVDAHGGRVDVQSRSGVGSVFTVRLPLVA